MIDAATIFILGMSAGIILFIGVDSFQRAARKRRAIKALRTINEELAKIAGVISAEAEVRRRQQIAKRFEQANKN